MITIVLFLVASYVAFLEIYVINAKTDTSKDLKHQQQILTFDKNTDCSVFYNV